MLKTFHKDVLGAIVLIITKKDFLDRKEYIYESRSASPKYLRK